VLVWQWRYRSKSEHLIKRYDLKGVVELHGSIDRSEALQRQQESQILLLRAGPIPGKPPSIPASCLNTSVRAARFWRWEELPEWLGKCWMKRKPGSTFLPNHSYASS
jgi:hypothetical protein